MSIPNLNNKCQYCQTSIIMPTDAVTCAGCKNLVAALARYFVIAKKPKALALIAAAKGLATKATKAHERANEEMVEELQRRELQRRADFGPNGDGTTPGFFKIPKEIADGR